MSKSKKVEAREGFRELMGTEVKPAIQKVQPRKQSKTLNKSDDLVQLMVWIPTDLMVKLKTKSVIDKKSMKEIVTEILEETL